MNLPPLYCYRPFGFLVSNPIVGSSRYQRLTRSRFETGNPKGLVIARGRSIRPFGFLVLERVAGSSRCRSLPAREFETGNPKGLDDRTRHRPSDPSGFSRPATRCRFDQLSPVARSRVRGGKPEGSGSSHARPSIRPFGFLVLERVLGSSSYRALAVYGFETGNPKGLVIAHLTPPPPPPTTSAAGSRGFRRVQRFVADWREFDRNHGFTCGQTRS